MSEYQYYEFQTIDRPLTAKEIAELRSYSTRARITPTSFVNDYSWGSFNLPEGEIEDSLDDPIARRVPGGRGVAAASELQSRVDVPPMVLLVVLVDVDANLDLVVTRVTGAPAVFLGMAPDRSCRSRRRRSARSRRATRCLPMPTATGSPTC